MKNIQIIDGADDCVYESFHGLRKEFITPTVPNRTAWWSAESGR